MKILSVLIPSRFRFDKMLRAVDSAIACVGDKNNLEVIVRFHKSDTESMSRLHELQKYGDTVKYILGEDFQGYNSLGVFCQELNDAATGIWCWHINNDMICERIEGSVPIDTQLKEISNIGVLCQPQWHKLGASHYENDAGGSAPIYPRTMYSKGAQIGMPPDTFIFNDAKERGWKIQFLAGVSFIHDWHGHEEYNGI